METNMSCMHVSFLTSFVQSRFKRHVVYFQIISDHFVISYPYHRVKSNEDNPL